MIEQTLQVVLVGAVLLVHVLALSALARGSGTRGHKIGWSMIILILPVIGVVAYVVWGQSPRDAHLPP